MFETHWTNGCGVEAMDYSYGLMDLTAYGRQEAWEDSPGGWPRLPEQNYRANGRPIPSGRGSKPGAPMIWGAPPHH